MRNECRGDCIRIRRSGIDDVMISWLCKRLYLYLRMWEFKEVRRPCRLLRISEFGKIFLFGNFWNFKFFFCIVNFVESNICLDHDTSSSSKTVLYGFIVHDTHFSKNENKNYEKSTCGIANPSKMLFFFRHHCAHTDTL